MSTPADQIVAEKPCSGSIPLVPFRYALMPKFKSDKRSYFYDGCPTNLDNDFDQLVTSAYSIRTIRPGYIYLYDEEAEDIFLWETDGDGYYTARLFVSLENYTKTESVGDRMKNISVCEDAKDVYISYSQDLWSNDGVTNNIKNRKHLMLKLSVPEILDGSQLDSTQKHVLPSKDFEKWVEEYKTPKSKYENQFGWSSNNPESVMSPGILKTLSASYSRLHKPKLPICMVLHDSVATAIDQSNITALYVHQLFDIKRQEDAVSDRPENNFNQSPGTTMGEFLRASEIPPQMRLDTRTLKSFSSNFYQKKILAEIIQSILESTLSKNVSTAIGSKEQLFEVLLGELFNEKGQEFIDFIDKEKLQKFNRDWDHEMLRIEKLRDLVMKASNDHATILKTMELDYADNSRNIAAVLKSYDRTSVESAAQLEQAIAHCIKGMGVPISGRFDDDPRFKLMEKWINTSDSPLYLGFKAFKPFESKLDTVGDLVGLGSNAIDEIHSLFPDLPSTNILVKEVTTFAVYKVATAELKVTDVSAVASESRHVVRNVMNTVSATGDNLKQGKAGLDQIMKAIQGRYGVVAAEVSRSKLTTGYIELMELAVTPESTSLSTLKAKSTSGSVTTISKVKVDPVSLSKMISEFSKTGVSAGVLIFQICNLTQAGTAFSRDASLSNSLNLGSALFGSSAALTELLMAGTNSAYVVRQKITGRAAKKAVEKGFLAKLSGPLQLVAAVFEASSLGLEATSLALDGDNDAALWAGIAGTALGAAGLIGGMSALVSSGLVASSALAMTGIGLIAAVGVLLLVGLGALYLKFMSEDRALDVWVSRTVFGVRRKTVWGSPVDTPFANLSEELQGYYVTCYNPVKLSDAKNILSKEAKTDWLEHGTSSDEARFAFLLPGYVEELSDVDFSIDGYDDSYVSNDKERNKADVIEKRSKGVDINWKESKLMPEGLYVYLNTYFNKFSTDSAGLRIEYFPQGRESSGVVEYIYVAD